LRDGRTWMIRAFIISSLILILTILCRAEDRQGARSDPQRFVEALVWSRSSGGSGSMNWFVFR
jgi:hypothetical protein